MKSGDILILNGIILSMAGGDTSLSEPAYIHIRDTRIAAIGIMQDDDRPKTADMTLDAGNRVVMPGLINGHGHAPLSLFRGLADDLPLQSWLTEHIFPSEAATVNPEMVYWCTKLSAMEMIRSGTTLVADGYFHEEDVACAFTEVSMRAVAAQGVIDFQAPGVPDPVDNINAARRYIETMGGSELVAPAVFCHSPYTCSPATIQKAKELTRELETLFFVHIAETEMEQGMIISALGDSPIRHLEALGVLDEKTICIHSVWLDERDIDILAASGAKVVSCPQSNMKLASGIAPLTTMIEQGILVGLGTDSCASNNSLDMFREMDVCAKLHKVHEMEPTVLPASQMLAMATSRGARVLGFDDLGTLEPGMLADMIIIDQQQPHLTPFYSSDTLVYAAKGSDVRDVIINGRLVMQDRRILTCDEQEVMAKVNELSRTLR